MAKTAHYHTRFEAGCYYHIYNRCVDKKRMFVNDGNYEYFLKQFAKYLSPVIDVYAYCLLGNHFHIVIGIRDASNYETQDGKTIHDIVSHQFRKFFQSYAMAFNKQQNRIGTLFQTPFKRVLIDSERYFTHLIYYVHANPQKHGLVHDFRDWMWSSYPRFMRDTSSLLQKQAVYDWFGSKETFIQNHQSYHESLLDEEYWLEEDGV